MRKAQSTLEYTILLIIIIAAFMTMQSYVKRGVQGRWKQSVDDLGEQYDPRALDSQVHYTIDSNSESRMWILPDRVNGINGMYTFREDRSESSEQKLSNSQIAH